MRRTLTLLLLVAGLVVSGCGDDNGGNGGGGGEASKPEVEVPDGPPPLELQIKDLKVGTGAEAVAGKKVTVHYVGVSYSDKEQFDASWDAGAPFPFTLGAGEVIQGWDEGVAGMKVGGRRQLIIPPALAYREFGQGKIKPNETLVFVVDLLDVA
ncbi:MAG: FKBP-type peptidyl-prolyl cis-trans isomerase [Acidimicrobiia bacterium]